LPRFFTWLFCKLIRASSFSVIIGGKSQKIHMDSSMLIAGGGIAGLATALALARQGLSCTVLEQSASFSEIGAGVQLGPNALRALAALGLREAIAPLAFWPEKIAMRDTVTGAHLHEVALGEPFENRFRERYACVHRGDLLKLLLGACRDHAQIHLCNAANIRNISDQGEVVSVTTVDNRRFEAEGLIGADGLWSTVRGVFWGTDTPRFSGDIALRALVPCTDSVRDVTLWLGPQLHVVAYPVRAGSLMNLVAICENPEGAHLRGWDVQVPKTWLSKFAGHHPALDHLLGAATEWSAWALHDRDPIHSWSKGRIALIGDAAHPCLQYLAQGACLALEDAVAIAKHLKHLNDHNDVSKASNPTHAFSAFSQERHARGAKMIRSARRMGQLYHADGAFRQIRNLGMRLIPGAISREAMAWIYEA
jgi:3-hydroxybenzoate 6-monooxygenase